MAEGKIFKWGFAQKNIFRLNFLNTTIESLLHTKYFFGVDSPSYQRSFVWDEHDKEKLLESIFMGADIGKFVLVQKDFSVDGELYGILDGKQRLNTLCEFYENRLAYKGYFFNELSAQDKNAFKTHPISQAIVRDTTLEEELKLFLFLNRGGKPMAEEHLEKIEEMLQKLQK